MDPLVPHLLSGGVREARVACAPADRSPRPGIARRDEATRDLDQRAAAGLAQRADAGREEHEGLLGDGGRPAAEAVDGGLPTGPPPSPCRRQAGRRAHGVHDQARRTELVADLREGARQRVGIARVGGDAERAALAQGRDGVVAPGDRRAAPAVRLEVVDDGSAEVARASATATRPSITGAKRSRG